MFRFWRHLLFVSCLTMLYVALFIITLSSVKDLQSSDRAPKPGISIGEELEFVVDLMMMP